MDRIFFTADTHFAHETIIDYLNRPFKTVEEMDSTIVENWNSTINDNDIVFHLGDVFFDNDNDDYIKEILGKLKGKKHLVPGNHDKRSSKFKILEQFFVIEPPLRDFWTIVDGQTYSYSLCHYPLEAWHESYRNSYNFHGHTHGRIAANSQRIDVGVDCWNFYPVEQRELIEKLKEAPQRECVW